MLLTIKPYEASRVLQEETKDWTKNKNLVLQSLHKSPPGPNGCTYIPGDGGSPSTLKQKNFTSHVIATPPPPPAGGAYPFLVILSGVATGYDK